MADTRVLEPRRRIFGERAIRAEVARFTRHPAYQAYRLLQAAFVLAPVLAGLDKFLYVLSDWHRYLAAPLERALPIGGRSFMFGVGLLEMGAGVWVALRPKTGALLLAGWLALIIVNLLLAGRYDLALRDAVLAAGAVALGLLAREFEPAPSEIA